MWGGQKGAHSLGFTGRCTATNARDWQHGCKPPAPLFGTTGKIPVDGMWNGNQFNTGGYLVNCKTIDSAKEDWPHIANYGSSTDTELKWTAPEPRSLTTTSFTPPVTQKTGLKTRCNDFDKGQKTVPLGYGNNNSDSAGRTQACGTWMHTNFNDTFRTTYRDVTNEGFKAPRRPTSAPLYGRRQARPTHQPRQDGA